jgi:hypothetical protein
LIHLGHADELNPGFPIFHPSHDTQLNAHGPLYVEVQAQLDALASY